MAVSESSGQDNSGDLIYKKDQAGNKILNEHNQLVQDHDLTDIAQAFEEWAKKEKLSFWSD